MAKCEQGNLVILQEGRTYFRSPRFDFRHRRCARCLRHSRNKRGENKDRPRQDSHYDFGIFETQIGPDCVAVTAAVVLSIRSNSATYNGGREGGRASGRLNRRSGLAVRGSSGWTRRSEGKKAANKRGGGREHGGHGNHIGARQRVREREKARYSAH